MGSIRLQRRETSALASFFFRTYRLEADSSIVVSQIPLLVFLKLYFNNL